MSDNINEIMGEHKQRCNYCDRERFDEDIYHDYIIDHDSNIGNGEKWFSVCKEPCKDAINNYSDEIKKEIVTLIEHKKIFENEKFDAYRDVDRKYSDEILIEHKKKFESDKFDAYQDVKRKYGDKN